MGNENEAVLEQRLKDAFTPENFGLMLQRIENVKELMALGEKKGMEKGMEKAQALTISTFLRKRPDMPDSEVANLFEVTLEYVRSLREKMKAG